MALEKPPADSGLGKRARVVTNHFKPSEGVAIPGKQAKKGARMKMVIDKAPDGTKSPNLADAVVQAMWPADQGAYDASFEWL